MVESFKEQVLPRIKKVHSIQEEGVLGSDGGDYKLKGYIDFVADFEGYEKPVIFDIKTSTGLYDQSKIAHSEQLAIYLSMVGEKYNTDLAGYIVLNKIINKVDSSSCVKCGFEKEGRHKTCPSIKDGVRCNGEWLDKKVVKPEVQILIVSKADEQIEEVLMDYSNILKAIKHEVVYRNVDHCDMFYGSPCIYRELCHNKCTKGLFKR